MFVIDEGPPLAERRRVLRLALALPCAAATMTIFNQAVAQEEDFVNAMFDDRPWLDEKAFQRLRILASSVIDLRFVYNGPNGYEGEVNFINGAYENWRQAFGTTFEEGFFVNVQQTIVPALDNFGDELQAKMIDLLEENGRIFLNWLNDLGVETESTLQRDLLRAQAMFAIAGATIILDSPDLREWAEFTWAYPFC